MSERKPREADRPVEIPVPTKPKLYEFIAKHFKGKESKPERFQLHLAYGHQGSSVRPEIIHHEEFRPADPDPDRDRQVAISNEFLEAAQEYCDAIGRPAKFHILVFNAVKGAAAYGAFMLALKPVNVRSPDGDDNGMVPYTTGEDGIMGDASLRDSLMQSMLKHSNMNNEHTRFLIDSVLKSAGAVIEWQGNILDKVNAKNERYEAMQFEWWKAMQEAEDRSAERKVKADREQVKTLVMERGAQMLMQLLPVVAKHHLEDGKDKNGIAKASDVISPSPQSIAIGAFHDSLNEEQRVALFGARDPQGNMIFGIFNMEQMDILGGVAQCKLPVAALEALFEGGQYAITPEQVTRIQQVVPMELLMPLYAMIAKPPQSHVPQGATP